MSTEPNNIQPVRFFHRGKIVDVSGVHPTRSVLDWLREDAHCTGTKEGCNEGDCGACTVVIGELATDANAPGAIGGLQLQTVNACIQFLPTLHGKALFTVEDLKGQFKASAAGKLDKATENAADKKHHAVHTLHPVQQAMVDCHGSQCGFCTPGFVMSLWSTYEHHQAEAPSPRASSWPTTCRATCAAAPATARSWTPASACSTCPPCGWTPRPWSPRSRP